MNKKGQHRILGYDPKFRTVHFLLEKSEGITQ